MLCIEILGLLYCFNNTLAPFLRDLAHLAIILHESLDTLWRPSVAHGSLPCLRGLRRMPWLPRLQQLLQRQRRREQRLHPRRLPRRYARRLGLTFNGFVFALAIFVVHVLRAEE